MARSNRSDRGASRRPTRRGTSSGRRPTGAHRTTRSGASTGRRPTTARGGSVTGRRTTRSGEVVRPKNNTPLMIGGLAIGVVVVVALVAFVAGSGGREKKKASPEPARMSAGDFRPKAAPKPRADEPRRAPRAAPTRKPRDTKPKKIMKPASFYKGLVDMNIWAEAQRLAAKGNKIALVLKDGKVPAGMTKKQAVRKARESLGLALDKGNTFLSPVEERDEYEDVEHFTATYNATLLRWSRQMRSISFGGSR